MDSNLNLYTDVLDQNNLKLLDLAPVPIFIHSNGVILYINDHVLDLFAVTDAGELLGKNVIDYIAPADVSRIEDRIKLQSEGREFNNSFIFKIIDDHEKVKDIEIKSSRIKFKDQPAFLVIAQNITRRKQLEQELIEKNLLIEKITQTVPDIIYVTDLSTNDSIFENYNLIEWLGFDQENLPTDKWSFLFSRLHPDDVEKIATSGKKLKNSKDDKSYVETEYRLKDSNDSWRWIYSRSRVFKRAADGTPLQNFGIAQDITEKKENEAKVLRSEKLYRTIAQNIPEGSVVVFDKDLKFILAEGPLLEKQGFKKNDIEGKSAFDKLPNGQSWDYFMPHYEKVLNGESVTLEIPYKEFFYFISILPLKDDNGEIYAGMAITIDIKDLMQTKMDLAKSETTRKAILDALPDLLFIMGEDGAFLEFIPSSEMEPLMPPEEFIGKKVSEVMPKSVSDLFKKHVALALETNEVQTYEYELPTGPKDIYFETRLSPVDDNKVIAVVRNITDLKIARQELGFKIEELSEKNIELEKYITSNLELEKYAYIASHDLKEPLRTIVGFSQLLEKRYKDQLDSEADEFISHIISGTKRMEVLVEGLLAYSRVESKGQPFEMTDFNELLKKIMLDLGNQIDESNAKVIFKGLPTVHCDNLQMRQLIQNLISNSIKFKGEGPLRIEISAVKENGQYTFSIADNGIGLDMNYNKKIFQIFQRLHTQDKYPGAGIGLSICKRIIDRHNGSIWVDSIPGEGTTFYFTIPDKKP